jgi:hypothetical protein
MVILEFIKFHLSKLRKEYFPFALLSNSLHVTHFLFNDILRHLIIKYWCFSSIRYCYEKWRLARNWLTWKQRQFWVTSLQLDQYQISEQIRESIALPRFNHRESFIIICPSLRSHLIPSFKSKVLANNIYLFISGYEKYFIYCLVYDAFIETYE